MLSFVSRWTQLGIVCQSVGHKVFCFLRNAGPSSGLEVIFALNDAFDNVNTISSIKRHTTAQQHERNDSERPHVCFFVVIAGQQFGRHGVHGPDLIVQYLIRGKLLTQTKVNDFYHIRVGRRKHDVFEFKITMHNTPRMHITNGGKQGFDNALCGSFRVGFARVKISTRAQFQYHVETIFEIKCFNRPDNVGMINVSQNGHFVL
mmetsp:Transcript_13488/g.25725  ORF Transcript_13488/g.25725 Transcript_13488/m.25725 type:complete len:204 (+) Transcript_13488:574-1185(+)